MGVGTELAENLVRSCVGQIYELTANTLRSLDDQKQGFPSPLNREIPIIGAYEFATNQIAKENESGAERLLLKRGVLQRNEFIQGGGIIHRNPAKALSGITIVNHHGHQVIYFLNLNGRMVAFNINEGTMCMCPRILPSEMEYSVDLVECGGRVLLVVLVEMMESASLRVWEFDWGEGEWKQLMAMPPAMSNVYYGKMVDINCVGYNDLIMMCISSRRFHKVVLCNISERTWMELPKCYELGTRTLKKFVSAYCF
ncbi:F-box only protein 13 [Cinnamomum micranthum f. kanehirae]|uniref:F-box only protein 13 n=1 Tax=Cinnamomum micranthum f. kanehirae TaxID=337451 RepID=A0A3S3MAV7_9MAGN|nr:F-box only protein 13 [Cinnamomum micranthum f. kanehirae]